MYAKARIVQPPEDGHVVVPQVAVNYSLYGDFVYVVAPDDKGDLRARQTVVAVSDRHGNLAAIASGLKPGDTIVAAGGVKLSNGSKVKVVESILEAKPAIGLD
jgi:membrane fusion protein (multidrug efflux system)